MHLAGLVLMASSSTEWSTLGNLRRMRGMRGRGGGKDVQGRVGVAAGVEGRRLSRKRRSMSESRRNGSRRRRRSVIDSRTRTRTRSRRRRRRRRNSPPWSTHRLTRTRSSCPPAVITSQPDLKQNFIKTSHLSNAGGNSDT